jgi:tetratricopeptide (TPR) repeat protein
MKEAQFRIDDSFIRVNQSATSRLDLNKTPQNIQGLLTIGLATCLAIIIVSADRKKISLTHTATAANADDIVRECEWAGDHCTIFIIKGFMYNDLSLQKMLAEETSLLPTLHAALRVRHKPVLFAQEFSNRFSYAVAVTRHFKIQFFGMNDVPRLHSRAKRDFWGLTADDFELREAIDLLHTHSCIAAWDGGKNFIPKLERKYHLLDLQYDGERWLPMPTLPISADYFLKDSKVAGGSSMLSSYLVKLSELYSSKYFNQVENIKKKATQLYMARNFNEAIEAFEKAIYILSFFYSCNPIRTGVPWLDEVREKLASLNYNVGMAYKYVGRHDIAENYLHKSLILRQAILGEGHNTTIKTKALYEELLSHNQKRYNDQQAQIKEKNWNDVRADYPALGLYSYSDLVSMGLVSKRGKELVAPALARVNAVPASETKE